VTIATGRYLIPAIQKLPGLISYYVGASPDGSAVHVSIWDSDEHAQQLNRLKKMIMDAGGTARRPVPPSPPSSTIRSIGPCDHSLGG
jgi:hypothetical protein